ncbi:hypothetical protein B0T21DRAFT_414136 [Apiosordaria backusii]|uniref:Uncharacterized protein n=1 Tax=Apiosordaria backusii TaxID=314023 RepID=A0AA40AXF2_9PEZI|nr:hypothetical protein B0T21DRAFT_414136 [Apiosordaria backusii]
MSDLDVQAIRKTIKAIERAKSSLISAYNTYRTSADALVNHVDQVAHQQGFTVAQAQQLMAQNYPPGDSTGIVAGWVYMVADEVVDLDNGLVQDALDAADNLPSNTALRLLADEVNNPSTSRWRLMEIRDSVEEAKKTAFRSLNEIRCARVRVKYELERARNGKDGIPWRYLLFDE